MSIKEKLHQAGEQRAAKADQRRIEKEERSAIKEAQRLEAERQRKLKEKLENQARIKQLQGEATEFGLSFSDYLAFLNCKHMEEVEDKLDSLDGDVSDLSSDVGDLERRVYSLENKTSD